MARAPETRFNCPQCSAVYRVVRVEIPRAADEEVACVNCGSALPPREDKFALKYFLVSPRTPTGRPRR